MSLKCSLILEDHDKIHPVVTVLELAHAVSVTNHLSCAHIHSWAFQFEDELYSHSNNMICFFKMMFPESWFLILIFLLGLSCEFVKTQFSADTERSSISSYLSNFISFLWFFEISCPLTWLPVGRFYSHIVSIWDYTYTRFYCEVWFEQNWPGAEII